MKSHSRQLGRVTRAGLVLLLATGLAQPIGVDADEIVELVPIRQIGGPGHAGLYGWGMATALDGSILVGDYWNFRIARFAPNGAYLGTLIANHGTSPGQHQSPYGIAVDPRNGDIYFGDVDHNRTVDKYDADGNFLFEWGRQGTGPGRFRYPSYVAVASDGTVFVSDQWDHNVVAHTTEGEELFEFGTNGADNGQFRQPRGLGFDAQDQLYVIDNYNLRVQVFSKEGVYLRQFGSRGTSPGQFSPGADLRGLAVDKVNGWVYVVDAASGFVNKFSTQGHFLLRFGGFGSGPGRFPGGGRAVTVDQDGDVWVGDMPGFRAQKFSPDGEFLLQVPSPAEPPPPDGFNQPRGVSLDSDGNIFVTDTHNWRVMKFAPDGTPLHQWGFRGGGNLGFNYQRGLDVDPRDGAVVVADTDNHMIKKFTNNGDFVWRVGGFGGNAGQFRHPHTLAVGPDGNIYVTDTQNYRVQVLSPDGAPLLAFGSQGGGNGQFQFPRGLTVDEEGAIWVADSGRGVIQRFSSTGEFLSTFGSAGTRDDQFRRAADVKVDDTYVYIADVDAHAIKVWTRTGQFVGVFGGGGTELGRMFRPHGLHLTDDGRLYVVEQTGERVQEFEVRRRPNIPDDEPPAGSIASPQHNEQFPVGPVVMSGEATDNVGVTHVAVVVRDMDSGLYWQPTGQWDGAWALNDATLSNPGGTSTTWSYAWPAPGPGAYTMTIRVWDAASNVSTGDPWHRFTLSDAPPDGQVPSGTIVSPQSNEQFPVDSVAMSGAATDNVGVTRVGIVIKNQATGLHWQPGGGWGGWALNDATLSAPGGTATDWSYAWPAPGPGTYTMSIRVFDAAGNTYTGAPWVGFTVSDAPPDDEAPSGTITAPGPNASFAAPPVNMSGNATDNVGVTRVGVVVRDVNTGLHWQPGGGWGGWALNDAALSIPGGTATDWSYAWPAPGPGTYTMSIRVFDAAGNTYTGAPWIRFTVTG